MDRGRAGRHDVQALPAAGIIFRVTPGDWRFDWHTATRRQYVINLDGRHQITASDGETRIIGVGEVILIEDVHGKGHCPKHWTGSFAIRS